MNINLNGFRQAFFEYKSKSHEGATKEQIKADLQKIFDEFGVDVSNFFVINMETEPKKEASISSYIDKVADGILKNEELKRQWKEAIDKKKEENQSENKTSNNKSKKSRNLKPEEMLRKRPISFNVSDVGDLPIEAAHGYMKKRPKLRGYTEEEMNQPLEQLSVLGVDDKAMDLNITPDENIVNQLVELSKKLYLVLVKAVPVDEVRNLSMTTLIKAAKNRESTVEYRGKDNQIIRGKIGTETEPDVEVSIGADGNSGANIEDDMLTGKDLAEIKKYKIKGISTHSEMVDFRESEYYKNTIIPLKKQERLKEQEELENTLFKFTDI